MTVQITLDDDAVTAWARFSLTGDWGDREVSVVGSFNNWTPGTDVLQARDDGTRSATVSITPGADLHFRYLATGDDWFDDPDADAVTRFGSAVFWPTDLVVGPRADDAPSPDDADPDPVDADSDAIPTAQGFDPLQAAASAGAAARQAATSVVAAKKAAVRRAASTSAGAAKKSAGVAKKSADVAKKSAGAAKKSAESARKSAGAATKAVTKANERKSR